MINYEQPLLSLNEHKQTKEWPLFSDAVVPLYILYALQAFLYIFMFELQVSVNTVAIFFQKCQPMYHTNST